jgi:hypothetical protein
LDYLYRRKVLPHLVDDTISGGVVYQGNSASGCLATIMDGIETLFKHLPGGAVVDKDASDIWI